MAEKPTKSKEQFVTEERAAEKAVAEAEFALRKAEVAGDAKAIAKARTGVDDERTKSLAIRKVMTEGLAQWHAWDSEQELARTARELGIA